MDNQEFSWYIINSLGSGLIQVDEEGSQSKEVSKIVGTTAKFVIYYK
jgi:hypothetical protein